MIQFEAEFFNYCDDDSVAPVAAAGKSSGCWTGSSRDENDAAAAATLSHLQQRQVRPHEQTDSNVEARCLRAAVPARHGLPEFAMAAAVFDGCSWSRIRLGLLR